MTELIYLGRSYYYYHHYYYHHYHHHHHYHYHYPHVSFRLSQYCGCENW